MIKERKGNLLRSDAAIIAHQVNCQGVMGAGVARQIRHRILTAEQYRAYQQLCRKNKEELLGSCSLMLRMDTDVTQYVAHLFCREYSHRQRIRYRLCSTETEPDCHDVPGSTAGIVAGCHSRLSGMRACRWRLGDSLQPYPYAPVFRVLLYPYHPVPAGQHPASLDGIWRHPYEPGNRMY